jgi:uncharacterized membrane protein YedE/YeeE
VVFGAGLAVSGMTNPAKVLAFLDFLGAWDPTLALVMGGALGVSAVGFALARRRERPWLDGAFEIPTRSDLDPQLVGGAVLFGLGWGLVGLCPGPALAGLFRGSTEVTLFVGSMLVGVAAFRFRAGGGAARSISTASVLLVAAIATAQTADPIAPEPEPVAVSRQLVSMPLPAQRLLRKDMIDHLVVLNQLYIHVAAAEFEQASELAETRLGNSSMGRHRGTGMGPGRFMPPEMHKIGISMHRSASEFAAIAQKQDIEETYAALQRVYSFCVACHVGFRIR